MDGRFAGRTAVITGGASGIGLAIARRYLAEGGRVVANDINPERVAALAAALSTAGVGSQQAVHGAHRTQVAALIEQGGVYRRWRGVTEALAAQGLQHQGLLHAAQCQR